MKFLFIMIVLMVVGGLWGLLMSTLLPQPWSLVASLVGGSLIGWYGTNFFIRRWL